jgi:hypothetical protein
MCQAQRGNGVFIGSNSASGIAFDDRGQESGETPSTVVFVVLNAQPVMRLFSQHVAYVAVHHVLTIDSCSLDNREEHIGVVTA